jgi:hypothetical protein
MAGEMFKMMAGVDLLHVPYRGAAPALTVNARLHELGGSALTGTSAQFAKLFVSDVEKWGKVVRAANIKAD